MNHLTTRVASLAALCGMATAAETAGAPARQQRNILFILADDLGWRDTSLTGSTFYETPNIERLARRGMTFLNAYAASPLCSPTRASIMTGQSPARCGITSPVCHLPAVVLAPQPQAGSRPADRQVCVSSATRLSTDHHTLAEALKQAGYATGHFGKWHLGGEPYSPLEHGFDVDVPHWPGPGPAGSFVAPWRFPGFKERTPKEHIEDRMADEAVAFMKAHRDRPFYLNYWQFSVHAPFDAKREYVDRYKGKVRPDDPQRSPTYAAMVRSLDDAVGTLLDALDALGIADRTIVIFYSDNGGNMYDRVDHTTPTSNLPLRGGKATLYEGGIRVPAIVDWPGVVAPGTRSEALVQSEDLYPTILAMAGAETRAGQACDGVSMLPALRGETPLRDAIYSFFPHAPAVPDGLRPSVCVRRGDWKLIRIFHDAPDQSHRYELYNLADDIGERRNLAAQEPDRVRELDALIERFLVDTQAVRPVKNPAYDPEAVSEAGGWKVGQGGHGILTVNRRMNSLQARAFEADMLLTTERPLDLPAGTYTLNLRMESYTSAGAGYASAGDGRAPIATIHDRHPHDYSVKVPSPGGSQYLSFCPSAQPGTTQIESVELLDPQGTPVRAWIFTGPARPPPRTGPPQRTVGGWTGGGNGHVELSVREGMLHLVSRGSDPMLTGPVAGQPGPGRYRLVFRMRSDARGNGQVFARPRSRGYRPGTGRRFDVRHDGAWHEYRIDLSLDHDLHELRLDPCAGPGDLDIQWLRLEAPDGKPAGEWRFDM